MDKKAFLKELERSLSVLQEDEIRDIISEYEQHIDMKVQSGQTEEQAISDFGSLSDLKADILEAYHVRADYTAEKKEKVFSFAEGEKMGQELLQQTGQICRKTGNGVMRLLHRITGWIGYFAGFCRRQICRPAAWINCQMKSRTEKNDKDGKRTEMPLPEGRAEDSRLAERREPFGRGIPSGAAAWSDRCVRMIAGAFHLCVRALVWGVRVCWNLCWGGFALCCAAAGLVCLFGLGMLAVLWMQHYPLAGVTIGCLGLVMCFFSAAGYAMTLLWRKEKGRTGGEKHA